MATRAQKEKQSQIRLEQGTLSKYSRFGPTPDNWAPNYPDGTVQGSIIYFGNWSEFKVHFSGIDDTEYEIYIPRTQEALDNWKAWLDGLGIVTFQMLSELGFE